MFNWFKPKKKSIAFIDGDQSLPVMVKIHQKYLHGVETHLVRLMSGNAEEPKCLRQTVGINKIYLSGYRVGKENTDKFIASYIQKSVQEGYTDITVVSSDYDFIDIFKMALALNPNAAKINFRLIVPVLRGRKEDVSAKEFNFEIVHGEV